MGQRFGVLILAVVLLGLAGFLGTSLVGGGGGSSERTPPSAIPGTTKRVKVEVLNAGGVPGAAWEATRTLRDRGFDVVLYDNAETYTDDPSVVLDRVDDVETARSVGETLGILLVRSEPDSTRLVDVSVHLGSDWTAPEPLIQEEEATHWWDFLRVFRNNDRKTPDSDT